MFIFAFLGGAVTDFLPLQLKDTPANLWEKYKDVGGIAKEDFFNYYAKNDMGCAFVIKSVTPFKQAKSPNDFIDDFVPPQSYVYLDLNTKE